MEELVQGIRFILGLQLIVVAILHFISRPTAAKTILALLCLILGLWFFKRAFYGHWQDHFLLFVLIGPGKPIFAAPLLLFYYRSFRGALRARTIVLFTAVPLLYYISLLIVRFFLIESIPGTNYGVTHLFSAGVFVIYLSYFFLTRRELVRETRKRLLPKAYKKVMILFYSLYFFFLQIPIWDIATTLLKQWQIPPASTAARIVSGIASGIYGYLYLLAYVLFIYGLSELAFLKRLILPKTVAIHGNTLKHKERLDDLMERYFVQEKIYKNPDLSIASCAALFNVPTRELIDYFKITQKGVFKDYINTLRVNEFKSLLHNESFAHYDLVGLSKECGFNSKSTFFRVFKEIEGITPNTFKGKVDRDQP